MPCHRPRPQHQAPQQAASLSSYFDAATVRTFACPSADRAAATDTIFYSIHHYSRSNTILLLTQAAASGAVPIPGGGSGGGGSGQRKSGGGGRKYDMPASSPDSR